MGLTMSWKAILMEGVQVWVHWSWKVLRIRRVLNQITPPSPSSAKMTAIKRTIKATKQSLRVIGPMAPTNPMIPVAATMPPRIAPAIGCRLWRKGRRKREKCSD